MRSAPRALIAGLGLIGGSIGMALRNRGWRVAYVDPNVELKDAQRAGAADERAESLGAGAEIVIIAAPVDVAIKLVGTRYPGPGTSVCSVMQPIRDAAKDERFIAGHPLAGSQEHGLVAARADLLRDRVWFVEKHDELLDRVVKDCGAQIEIVDARDHDVAIALTSHLPQLLSTALAAYLDEHDVEDRFIGTGLRTFLRLAGSEASVWMPVLEANRKNIEPNAAAVEKIVREILRGDATAFQRAQRLWSRLQ